MLPESLPSRNVICRGSHKKNLSTEGTPDVNHDVQSQQPDDDPRLADKRLELAFRILALGGLAFILLGSAMQLFANGELQPELIALDSLFASLLKLQPQALTTFGIIALILGPALGLLVLIWTYARQRERLIPLVALLVFTIIMLSVPIEHWTRGA